jgi:hypothetical protein
MLGGARIVRVVVLQESKITVSATAPPAPHNKLSRLRFIHRVSLECHTNGEYAQKSKTMTTHFFGGFSYCTIRILPMCLMHPAIGAVFGWRLPRKAFEHAIELRERLKSCREGDFTNAQILILQEGTGSFEASACDILDKINAGYLFEIFTQMVRVHFDHLRHFGQGKFFARVFFDELPRSPDRDRLSSISRTTVLKFSRR